MSISRKKTPQPCLIAGEFSHPKHMLDPLNRLWRDLGFTKSTKDFLRDILDLFCRQTAFKDKVGFAEGESPIWGFTNAFLVREFDTSKRQIQRYIRRLEDIGVIERSIDNGNRRVIDFTPLPALAVQWKRQLEREIENQTRSKEILSLYRKCRHRASVLLQNTIPCPDNAEFLNQLRTLLEASADSNMSRENLIQEFRETIAAVEDAIETTVEKNLSSTAKMSSPHDKNTDPYITTTPDPFGSVVDGKKKGVAALIGAKRRAATDQTKPNKEEGVIYTDSPVKPDVAWRMILQLAPAFASAQRVSHDPTEQAHEIARTHVQVRPDLLGAAIFEHGAINVIAALAIAFTQTKFHKDFNGNVVKAKAAYATGILSKFRPGAGVPANQIFNPWPSMFARLKSATYTPRPGQSAETTLHS